MQNNYFSLDSDINSLQVLNRNTFLYITSKNTLGLVDLR
jgi:hypothetical protein